MEVSMENPNVSDNNWRILGPGGGGAQYIPTINPFDPKVVFVTCDMTGSYITNDGGGKWRQVNFNSRVLSFAFDPKEKNVAYAGATGLYRSCDACNTWELVFPDPKKVTESKTSGDHAFHRFLSQDNWSGGSIQSICIDAERTELIYIGVNTSKLDIYYTEGNLLLLFSTDKGSTWNGGLTIEGDNFLKIYVDESTPEDRRVVYIFTDRGIFELDTCEMKLKKLLLPPDVVKIEDVACGKDKRSQDTVFYMTSVFESRNDQFHTGVFRSINKCEAWEELTRELDSEYIKGQERRFTRIATCESDTDVLYLAIAEPTSESLGVPGAKNYFGIFKSENRGDSWEWVLKISDVNPENRSLGWIEQDYNTGWGGAPFNLGVCPTNADICYASDWGTAYRTINGGKTWEQVYCTENADGTFTTRGLDVTLVFNVHFDPFDKEHFAIACTDIALFDTFNSGKSWRHTFTGVPKEWTNGCYCVAFDPEVRGRAWSVWSNCHDLPRPKMFKNSGFANRRGGVCKTDDNLCTWVKASNGMDEKCAPTCIVLDPKSPASSRVLYVAAMGKGVYKSCDDGNTWRLINNGIEGNLNAWKIYLLPDGTIYLLVARGLENGQQVDGAIYRSMDDGESWKRVPMPENANFPNFMDYDPTNINRMYLACWPKTVNGIERYGGVYITEDGGMNWRIIFDESSNVYGVAVDPKAPSTIYISNFENSVLRSDDMGNSWERLVGYDFKWAHQPILDPYNDDMLYVATFGSSLWYGPRRGITKNG